MPSHRNRPRRPTRDAIKVAAGFVAGLVLCSLTSRSPPPDATAAGSRRAGPGDWATPDAGAAGDAAGDRPRPRATVMIGVQTGYSAGAAWTGPKYNYVLRRQALRTTWFPPSQAALDALQASSGVVLRFVVGRTSDAAAAAIIDQEEAKHGGFMRLPIEEAYLSLTNKTLTFFRQAIATWDVEYVMKVDDDVYLRVDRVPLAALQWGERAADYVGCMKRGPVYTTPNLKWHEPQHALIGETYFTHCWGTTYVLSGRAAAMLGGLNAAHLRFFANEDVTVGAWMLALGVHHLDDRRLCESSCSPSSISVFDMPKCAGLCEPAEQLPKLHASPACRTPSAAPLPQRPAALHFHYTDVVGRGAKGGAVKPRLFSGGGG